MNLYISADHRGSDAAKRLHEHLIARGANAQLMGDCADGPCDYPDRAFTVAHRVASEPDALGVLLCGSGIGMAIAANKVDGIRAAVVHDELTAQLSRAHNNANILCLSADLLGQRLIAQIVDTWLDADFEGGRHQRRIDKISAIEKGAFQPAP